MPIEPFHLERYFADFEFETPVLLGASDCETISVGELFDLDSGARERFERLRLGYTHSDGGNDLRVAIADSYADPISPEDVLVHTAGVEVVTTLMLAALEPGDRALVQMPCYQVLRTAPELAGAAVDRLETAPGEGWRVTAEAVAAGLRPETRLVALNSPHNPTGRVVEDGELRRIAEICAERDVMLFVDEAYRGTRHGGPVDEFSAAELGEHVVTLGLVSKGYGLPGLRLGWLVCRDPGLRSAVERVKDYTTICAPAPSEFLAEIAIRNRVPLLERTRERLRAHLELLRPVLRARADVFDWIPPDAGPITFPTLTDAGVRMLLGTKAGDMPDDRELAERIRREAGVLVIPGRLFDARVPAVRIGFGRSNFPEGLARLTAWLDGVLDG
jgi:aspartate/methionine/tyrosine aminotransferase